MRHFRDLLFLLAPALALAALWAAGSRSFSAAAADPGVIHAPLCDDPHCRGHTAIMVQPPRQ